MNMQPTKNYRAAIARMARRVQALGLAPRPAASWRDDPAAALVEHVAGAAAAEAYIRQRSKIAVIRNLAANGGAK